MALSLAARSSSDGQGQEADIRVDAHAEDAALLQVGIARGLLQQSREAAPPETLTAMITRGFLKMTGEDATDWIPNISR
jgi:hypothetical protein